MTQKMFRIINKLHQGCNTIRFHITEDDIIIASDTFIYVEDNGGNVKPLSGTIHDEDTKTFYQIVNSMNALKCYDVSHNYIEIPALEVLKVPEAKKTKIPYVAFKCNINKLYNVNILDALIGSHTEVWYNPEVPHNLYINDTAAGYWCLLLPYVKREG